MTSRSFAPSFIPPSLPDQTLYSWVAMFHHLSGNSDEAMTRRQLFGSGNTSLHFLLPANLDTFCNRTDGVLGTPQRVMETLTVVPFYTRLRDPFVAERILDRVRGNGTAGITRLLGIAKSAVQEYSHRRSCPACRESDHAKFGFVRWRRTHQLPGVLICTEHQLPLSTCEIRHSDRRSSRFLSPNDNPAAISALPLKIAPEAPARLSRIARLAEAMLTSSDLPEYSSARMHSACLAKALQLGIIGLASQELNLSKAMLNYRNHFHALSGIPEISSVCDQIGVRPLWDILRRRGASPNPLALLLMIEWMFGEWETFLSAYRDVKPS